MKKIAILMVLVMVLSMGAAFAAEPGEGQVGVTADSGSYTNDVANAISAVGGNISTAALTTTASTVRWAGISGTVTGTIVIGDSSSATLYEWASATPVAVYAALTADTIDWAGGLNDGTKVAFEADFLYLNDANATNDGYSDTFGSSRDLVANVGSNMFTAGACPFVQTEDGTNSSYWYTLHCQDDAGQTVLVGEVDSAGHTNYANVGSINYQMLIPELGGQGEEGSTSWDLWVELE